MGNITDIKGILAGHYTDKENLTGCTAILCPAGAVAGVDVRGSAPGTRETDLLRGFNVVERIHGILLSGGSAYGLDAASGVMQFLEEQGIGMDVGVCKVPIVPAAVIFDLGVGNAHVRPGKEEGYKAAKAASEAPLESGNLGAGTGATIGKAFGPGFAMRGGIGSSCVELPGGVKVAAVAVVNALGNVYDPDTGKIVAGAYKDGEFLSCTDPKALGAAGFGNTTIGIVITNAKLSREEANKLASMAHDGLAQSIRPVHTSFDGDTFFAMSTGEIENVPVLPVLVCGVKAVCDAVLDAVGYEGVKKA